MATSANRPAGSTGLVSARTATLSAFCAEIIGTFMLTFSGTATILAVHKLSAHSGFYIVDDIAVSVAFAIGIVAAIYMVAGVSGAHINPAITVGLAVVGKFPWRAVPVYVVAQFVGGILAGLMNLFMFGSSLGSTLILGATKPGPGIPWYTALVTEFVITLVLMLVVMATAVYERAPGGARTAGISIALWIGAGVFLALPISGGSMNPARTIGPEIVAVQLPYWWVYIVGPVIGATTGAALWAFVLSKGRKEVVEAEAQASGPIAGEGSR